MSDAIVSYEDLAITSVTAEPSAYYASPLTPDCKKSIAGRFHIPELILDTYLKTEGGYPGHIRTNEDGSWDVGPMQINSTNWPMFYDRFGLTPLDIRFNGCMNLMAGAYLIRTHLDQKKPDNVSGWSAFFVMLADYHSKTPSRNKIYQMRWVKNFNQLLTEKE